MLLWLIQDRSADTRSGVFVLLSFTDPAQELEPPLRFDGFAAPAPGMAISRLGVYLADDDGIAALVPPDFIATDEFDDPWASGFSGSVLHSLETLELKVIVG